MNVMYRIRLISLGSLVALAAILLGGNCALAQDRWQSLVPDSVITGASALAYHPSGRLFVGLTGGMIGIIENATLSLTDVGNNDARIVRFQFAGSDTVFAWLDPVRYDMLRSVDGGATWHPVREPHRLWPPLAATGGGDVVSMLYEAGNKTPGVRSSDGGATWVRIDPAQFDTASVRNCLDIVAGPDGAFYAGFQGDSAENLYRSGDGGATWRPLSLAAGNISHMVVTGSGAILASTMTYPSDPGDIRGIYRSDDAGESWTLTLPLGFIPPGSMRLDVVSSLFPAYSARAGMMIIVAGSQWKVMRSGDDGRTWMSMTTNGLRDTHVVAIAASADGAIVCATLDNLYRYVPATGAVPVHASKEKPEARVENGELLVAIPHGTEAGGRVELYDMNARRVQRIDLEPSSSTGRVARINIHGLPSARYILVVQMAEGEVSACPVSLVR